MGIKPALLMGLGAGLAVMAWWLWPAQSAQPDLQDPMAILQAAPPAVGGPSAGGGQSVETMPQGGPLSPAGLFMREQQIEASKLRLAQAEQALRAYEQHARYPHGSRPAKEHPDQLRPFDPVVEEHPLRTPGGTAMQGVKLVTSQERIFLSGPETSRVSVRLQDAEGNPLPLRMTRSVFKEVTEPGRTAQTPERQVTLSDDGQGGLTTVLAPSLQGFGSFAGRLRLELWMQYGGQPGFTYFDLIYNPGEAARWLPGVAESVTDGSLQLALRAEVLRPGRYVVSARVDDAKGEPIAVLLFNEELGAGPQQIPLQVHGRLLHDLQPAMPLRLRDVEAFLLIPDTFPDRIMLPRLAGVQHRTQSYSLDRFTQREWQSGERERYMAELGKDVEGARAQLKKLGGP